MPLYDYKCNKCDKVVKDVFVKSWNEDVICDTCKTKMERMFPMTVGTSIFPDEGITLEHIGPEPMHFGSLKKLKQYAKKHDLDLGALL